MKYPAAHNNYRLEEYQSKLLLLQSKLKAGEDSANTTANFENVVNYPIRKQAEQDLALLV